MAHTEQVNINGILTTARVFDQPAQAIDDAVSRALPGGAIDTDLALKAPLASPALTGTPTINGVAAANVGQLCNPNLLDNWYFGNPVDQRGGYVVPTGVNVYNDADLTSLVGTSSVYYKVVEFGSSYVKILNESGGYFYAARSAAVRGYTGNMHTIDRWCIYGYTSGAIALTHDGINISGSFDFGTVIEMSRIPDDSPITASFLFTDGFYPFTVANKYTVGAAQIDSGGAQCVWLPNWPNADAGTGLFFVNGKAFPSINRTFIAAKLELGTTQTLARQENGNWVLNEIPNYAETMAKCQRHQIQLCNGNNGFVGIGTAASATDCKILLPIPTTLRTTPSITYSGSFVLISGAGDNRIPVTAMSVQFCSNNAVSISCTTAGSLTVGQAYKLYYINNQAKLLLDANL